MRSSREFIVGLIFCAKRGGRVEKEWTRVGNTYPKGIQYAVQEKAWMDQEGMLDWIRRVWGPWVDKREGIKLMIIDKFSSHLCAPVLAKLAEHKTMVEVIPGGYTSKLQVLDVGVNRPFKDAIRLEHELFMVSSETRAPKREDVAGWVKNAWDSITKETIINTWESIDMIHNNEGPASI